MTGLRAGEVADAAGVNRQTLRYYERVGLLAEPGRTLGGHRMYPAETVTVIRVIKAAQRLGFTLDEVAELLDLGTHRHGKPGLQVRATAKLAEVETRIADLEIIRDTLKAAVAAGCDDLIACSHIPSCPLPFAGLAEGKAADAGSCC
ncbi:MerR family transcriptional regulator [Lentzea aerocolonigenes]|uniref:MerR family transcriptional regulator n=1 Tax=Lentzea aerocolonigenes TaxID=68170 RepID=UPI0004C38F6B|nr:MerR family transcriptional regulator [Lentzea aerocolonigenes]MCP2242459.1 DNA-binding transcriptional regulator, MerR family [Lentzea aerocolonigenes]